MAASITVSSLLILLGFLWPGGLDRLALALLVVSMPVLLVLLGRSRGSQRRLRAAMVALWLLLGGSWAALIWIDGNGVPVLGGVPLVLWILVLGLGFLPLVLVSLAFAATFRAGRRQASRSAHRRHREGA